MENFKLKNSKKITNKNKTFPPVLNLVEIIKSFAITYLFSVFLLIISAIIFTYTKLPESLIKVSVSSITLFGALSSGFLISKKAGSKGILTGAFSGIIYLFILFLIRSFSTNSFAINLNFMLTLILSIICGSIGGIIGVNFSSINTSKS